MNWLHNPQQEYKKKSQNVETTQRNLLSVTIRDLQVFFAHRLTQPCAAWRTHPGALAQRDKECWLPQISLVSPWCHLSFMQQYCATDFYGKFQRSPKVIKQTNVHCRLCCAMCGGLQGWFLAFFVHTGVLVRTHS